MKTVSPRNPAASQMFADPAPQAAPAAPRDVQPSGVIPAVSPAVAPSAACWAIGRWDAGAGRMVYVSRAASAGNLMSTSDPMGALTFQAPGTAELWVGTLPDQTREQLTSRSPVLVPLVAVGGEPVPFMVPAQEQASR
jgi:hypothetical protein